MIKKSEILVMFLYEAGVSSLRLLGVTDYEFRKYLVINRP